MQINYDLIMTDKNNINIMKKTFFSFRRRLFAFCNILPSWTFLTIHYYCGLQGCVKYVPLHMNLLKSERRLPLQTHITYGVTARTLLLRSGGTNHCTSIIVGTISTDWVQTSRPTMQHKTRHNFKKKSLRIDVHEQDRHICMLH